MGILIFQTNVNLDNLSKITPVLNTNNAVQDWSIDLEDIDKVLRVVTSKSDVSEKTIINILLKEGIQCISLPE